MSIVQSHLPPQTVFRLPPVQPIPILLADERERPTSFPLDSLRLHGVLEFHSPPQRSYHKARRFLEGAGTSRC